MRNGAGTYVLPAGNPVVTNTTISSTWANNTLSDIAGALTQSLSKDGQTVPTANLPMGGFKLINLAAGSAPGNSLRYEQLFSQGVPTDIASAGTVDIGGEYNTFLNVTGNTTITSFGTNYNGPRFLTFKASLTITHDATTLILPAGENIVTQAGDVAIFIPKCTVSGTSDGWRLAAYYRDDNFPLVNDTITIASAATLNFKTTQAQFYSITGTTDVTAVTMYEAQPVYAIAAGAFKLVNSSSLIVQGAADYTTTVGDILCFIKDGSGNVSVFGIVPVKNTANDPAWSSDSPSQAASTQWVNAKALIKRATAVTTTGGTFIDFTSIPSGVKRLKVSFVGFSTSGSSIVIVQLGKTTPTTSGYLGAGFQNFNGSSANISNGTTGFLTSGASNAAAVFHGAMTIDNVTGNTWVASGVFGRSDGANMCMGAGSVTLADVPDLVRITTVNGTDTIDANTAVNVSWEY